MITTLKLINFKAFRYFEEDFASLNLITGLNGMGKSTIIQSLLLLRQSYKMGKLNQKGLFLNGEYVKIGKGKDLYWIHGEEEFINIDVCWNNSVRLNMDFIYQSDTDVLPIKAQKDDFIFNQSLFNENFKYLNAERIGQRDIYPSSEYEVSENKSLGVNGEFTTHFIEKNMRSPLFIKDLLHPNNKTNDFGVQINMWLSDISPGVSFVPQSIIDSEISRQFYEFEYGSNKTRQFRSVNVGFGLNYILPVLAAILFSKPGDLLLIENPEAHLHPKGQSRIGYLLSILSSQGVQVFVETHSDHILNGIRVGTKLLKQDPKNIKLFYFDRDISKDKHETRINKPILHGDGRIENMPDGFFDEWDNMLDLLI